MHWGYYNRYCIFHGCATTPHTAYTSLNTWFILWKWFSNYFNCYNLDIFIKLSFGLFSFQKRTKAVDGYRWRCNASHETSVRSWSFFQNSHFTLPDIFQFIVGYLDGISLYKLPRRCCINYSSTSVDWASPSNSGCTTTWKRCSSVASLKSMSLCLDEGWNIIEASWLKFNLVWNNFTPHAHMCDMDK